MISKNNIYLTTCLIFLSVFCYSQNPETAGNTIDYNNINMPESPSASAFNAVGKTNVNTATGVPTIRIPLYNYEVDGVTIPVYLTYNATGVKVTDFATSVGLNWSLVAGGQITRTVRGKRDEYEGWFDTNINQNDSHSWIPDSVFDSYDESNAMPYQRLMSGVTSNNYNGFAKNRDHNPDTFNYSVLDMQGEYIHKPDGTVIKSKVDGVTIFSLGDGDTDFDYELDDLNGNHYDFYYTDTEKSSNTNIYSANGNLNDNFYDWEGAVGYEPVTAWKLSKVTTKNNKTIDFEYQEKSMAYTWDPIDNTITIGDNCQSGASAIQSISKTVTQFDYTTLLIKKISSLNSSIKIDFYYSDDSSLPDDVWKTKLTKIRVSDALSSYKKEFVFTYDRFTGDPRLKLTSVAEQGKNGSNVISKPAYVFSYESGSLPNKESLARDFFGFFNNISGNNSLVPERTGLPQQHQSFYNTHSGDRSLNTSALDIGVLTEITYPTGGSSLFTYEPNRTIVNGVSKYMGGLRIKEIEDTDETGTYHKKIYQYENLEGFDYEGNKNLTVKNEGNAFAYYGSFVNSPGGPVGYKPGYFYKKVTIKSYSGVDNFKEEYIYEENPNALHTYDYALKESNFYKETQLVKKVEYINNIVGSPTVYNWNILGDRDCFYDSFTYSTGHSGTPTIISFKGGYNYVANRIATTEFLKAGTSLKAVTTLRDIVFDGLTTLKKQEIVDHRYKRIGYDDYQFVSNSGGEKLTVDYQYPGDIPELDTYNLPQALPISKLVKSLKESNSIISGQYFEYDTYGNIKKTYAYNKGESSNSSTFSYIPSDYELKSTFLYDNGRPVEVINKDGVATAYIWGYQNQYPVAKIEGVSRTTLNLGVNFLVNSIESITNHNNLSAKLRDLRRHTIAKDAMVTTYTYYPLIGPRKIIDSKEDQLTYYYDTLGRLSYINDKDGNRVTESEYNFAN